MGPRGDDEPRQGGRPLSDHLKFAHGSVPAEIKGEFDYGEDGSFTRAMTRCVGVGACRRHDSNKGVMCASYMATREERYSTRGRARLLFEMLNGDPIKDDAQPQAIMAGGGRHSP